MLYFHRDHVWPGWAVIEAPDAWDKDTAETGSGVAA
jgi:hypothetical protein